MRRFLLIAPLIVFALIGYVLPTQVEAILARGPASAPNPATLAFVSPTPSPLASTLAPDGQTPRATAESGERALVATPTPAIVATPTPIPGPVRRPNTERAPPTNAKSVVVMDGASGEILYELNAHMRVAPASTTKIMTSLVALENGKPSDVVIAEYDPKQLDPDSTLMGVYRGDKVTLEDLLYGVMLPSGNEASVAVANHIAGSTKAFAVLMNKRAVELGMLNSNFVNPHGLDEANHYSSAYDLTLAARYAYGRYPLFADLSKTRIREVKSGDRTFDIYNLNRLLGLFEGADGVKIGYTDAAGRTIIGSASRNGNRVFVGLMNTQNTAEDAAVLLEWAFRSFTWPVGPVPVSTPAVSTP
ncbi:MAG TPA: D-alanyl-D-alanine carboxypeptidase [Chloroflexota bacterium]|nr:D-alanyl-D-alanine carboxypeptidase [Chloroflexota bacterium]